ncbi:DivIVA domain-containing protein [Micromonospora sagamiensis]|uniref:DivIVA domain-containing protein n=1 Tax=Micromonospora sagamiensis TaxID=47875 RepID=A0A562WB68_9ACTN|nr:DivIVA domain-containing protein [Micromonospora sagamiensis]TWJ26884.1 DivIVA domain-containing protein [Micromonospora sagamiensis]BCL14227.1 hypothetical protein GCM10017556_19660 [Micromonospora sagamiensis]
MRNPFRRFRRDAPADPAPVRHRVPDQRSTIGRSSVPGQARPVGMGNAGRHHRSAAYRPLCAGRVRDRQFPLVRRGLDPGEVTAFLHRVADDLAALHAELDQIRNENARIKQSLRDWQSRFAPRVHR